MAQLQIVFLLVFLVSAVHASQSCGERSAQYLSVSSSQAQFEAGKALMKEDCPDEAVAMWEKAANADHAEATFRLGLTYQGGSGGSGHVRANPRKAFPYFVKSAELGDMQAMYMLALHYENGTKFMKKDIPLAWKWYLAAAEKGQSLAIERIIKAYREGELGQEVSPEKAKLWSSRLSLSENEYD